MEWEMLYSISYVYISSYERAIYDIDEEYFSDNYQEVFSKDDVIIYSRY